MMSNNKWNTSMDAATLDAAWKGIGERRTRARNVRRVKMAALPLLASALIAIFVVIVGRRPLQQPLQRVQPVQPVQQPVANLALQSGAPLPVVAWDSKSAPKTIDFDDGSHLLLAKGALIKALPSRDPARVDLLLESGAATFDIKPHGPRAWVIDAGNGTIVRVLGTRFTVTREAKHVRVAVERGKVRVESALVQRDLVAGQDIDVGGPSGGFGTTESAAAPTIPVENLAPAPVSSATRPTRKAPTTTTTTTTTAAPAAEPTTDLFVDADAARKAGRPRDAVAILKSVEREKSLAAFTIGKIHAEELHEPAVAAMWFERAIQLGLASGLEEDAYARVVDSYAQAGQADQAARAASLYESKFPNGRHLARVKRWTAKH